MKERWISGVWLGKKWSSDEHIISVDSGKIVRVRNARPEVDAKLYDPLRLLGVRGTPSNPSAMEEEGTVHIERCLVLLYLDRMSPLIRRRPGELSYIGHTLRSLGTRFQGATSVVSL